MAEKPTFSSFKNIMGHAGWLVVIKKIDIEVIGKWQRDRGVGMVIVAEKMHILTHTGPMRLNQIKERYEM